MADEAIPAASTTMPMPSMHYFCEFSSDCVLSGTELNGAFYMSWFACRRKFSVSIFIVSSPFRSCVEVEIKMSSPGKEAAQRVTVRQVGSG